MFIISFMNVLCESTAAARCMIHLQGDHGTISNPLPHPVLETSTPASGDEDMDQEKPPVDGPCTDFEECSLTEIIEEGGISVPTPPPGSYGHSPGPDQQHLSFFLFFFCSFFLSFFLSFFFLSFFLSFSFSLLSFFFSLYLSILFFYLSLSILSFFLSLYLFFLSFFLSIYSFFLSLLNVILLKYIFVNLFRLGPKEFRLRTRLRQHKRNAISRVKSSCLKNVFH